MMNDIRVKMSNGTDTIKIVKSISGTYVTDNGTVTRFESGLIKLVRAYRAAGYEVI